MDLPRIHMDFNSNSLANIYTLEDIKRQGIEFHDGMRGIFYDFDAEEGVSGLIHTAATVWWDESTGQFRLDISTYGMRFTPGKDLSVLDGLYDA